MSDRKETYEYEYRVTVHHYVKFDDDELDEHQTPEDFARENWDKGYECDRDVDMRVELYERKIKQVSE